MALATAVAEHGGRLAALARQLPVVVTSDTCARQDRLLASSHKMSIPFSGCRTRSAGVFSAITKQLRSVNLKPVTRIDVRFDPFHENVKPTRDFLFYFSGPKIVATNPYCLLKTEILCDRSDPSVTFNLQSGEKVVFKTGLLTSLNILELYNKHISSLAPPDPAELEAAKALEGTKKKRRKRKKIKEGAKRRGVFL